MGSTGIAPLHPIVIRSAHGTLSGIALTNPDGTAVKGKLSAD